MLKDEDILDFGKWPLARLNKVPLPAVADAIERGQVQGVFGQSDLPITAALLQQLAALPAFPAVVLNGAGESGLAMHTFEWVRGLRMLGLDEAPPAIDLNQLPVLEALYCCLPAQVRLPQSAPRLQTLHLRKYPHADCVPIAEVGAGLVDVSLIQAAKLTTLAGLEQLSGARRLCLAYCPKLQDLSAIGALVQLESLELQNLKQLPNLDFLAPLQQLTALRLENCGELPSLAVLPRLPALKSLVLVNTRIVDADLRAVTGLPALEHFYIKPSRGYQPDAAALNKRYTARGQA